MTKISDLSLVELACYISSHLHKHDISVALVGGSCVAIYSDNKYTTKDLDFIELHYTRRDHLREVLRKIGFREEQRYFVHSDCEYLLEFPSGPLSIGSAPVNNLQEIETEKGVLKLLTPTDCIKDRLAAFYFWNDRQSLTQALSVAAHHKFDTQDIKLWSKKEDMLDKFKEFESSLK